MSIIKCLTIVLLTANLSFSKEIQMFTNQTMDGDFTSLHKSPTSYLSKPSDAKISNLKIKVRKIKANRFRIIITGNLLAKLSGKKQRSVDLDVFNEHGWVKTNQIPGNTFTLKITFLDKDLTSQDNDLTGGYQDVNLPYSRQSKDKSNPFEVYQGNFKLMYQLSFADISMQIGSNDIPDLNVQVIVPDKPIDKAQNLPKKEDQIITIESNPELIQSTEEADLVDNEVENPDSTDSDKDTDDTESSDQEKENEPSDTAPKDEDDDDTNDDQE